MNLSPLRYPGGKSRAIKILEKYLPETKELISPFFGGGSFELYCAKKGISVKGYDSFSPLVDFWQCLLENPKKLQSIVKDFHPITKERFYILQKEQEKVDDKYQRAAIFFVLNRASFSGSTLSGGMSPSHPRFNEACIEKLGRFKAENISVENKTFEVSILENTQKLFYLDPPYLIKYNLYGKMGNTHKGFNHHKLKEILDHEPLWLLSYNNCNEIKNLYQNYDFIVPDWKYGMSKEKEAKEILIFSNELSKMLKKKER